MSESSVFRTDNDNEYVWPPQTIEADERRTYRRVTKVIGEGEPKDWMRNYVAAQLSNVLVDRAGDITAYMVNSHSEIPQQFSIDQEWWNGLLDEAHQKDLNQAAKREAWDRGELPHLKTRPAKPYMVNALLELSPPLKFMKWFKAAPDIYRDDTALRGTEVHGVLEEIAKGDVDAWYEPELFGWVFQGRKFLERFKPEFVEIESVVYSDKYGYAGQFDWIARIPVSVMLTMKVYNKKTKKFEPWKDRRSAKRKAESPDYIWVWGDYKTGDKGIKENIALQFSGYFYSDFIGRADGTKDPIPTIDEFWGVSVREDTYEIVPVTVNRKTFRAFLAVRSVGEWMTQTRKTVLNRPYKESK